MQRRKYKVVLNLHGTCAPVLDLLALIDITFWKKFRGPALCLMQRMGGGRHGGSEIRLRQPQNSPRKSSSPIGDFMREIVPGFPKLPFVSANAEKPI